MGQQIGICLPVAKRAVQFGGLLIFLVQRRSPTHRPPARRGDGRRGTAGIVAEGNSLNRQPFCSGACSRTSPRQTRFCSSPVRTHRPGSRDFERNGRISRGKRPRPPWL